MALTPSKTATRGCPSSVAAMEMRFCRSRFCVLPISTHSSPALGSTPPNSLTGTVTPSPSEAEISTQYPRREVPVNSAQRIRSCAVNSFSCSKVIL